MDAAFMSYQQHDGGIHALWLDAGEAGVTEVRFRGRATPSATTSPTAAQQPANARRAN
jgi:hypothetical protein